MQLFYKPGISGNVIVLDETESRHCIRVLRLTRGGLVQLVDGVGGFYTAKISEPDIRHCKLEIITSEQFFEKKNTHLHIAISPTKNIDRFEWFLEKATEIGIDEITPIITHHSERKSIKPERLNKILVSAMKQSIKAYLPKLNEILQYNKFIGKSFDAEKLIAHCGSNQKPPLKSMVEKNKNNLILIGPEGDFSEEEIKLALQNGYNEISLGNARLRTETAGIVACHTVNLLNDES
jgi:16S rRNA (uracil1498-N3)-methyltransferase